MRIFMKRFALINLLILSVFAVSNAYAQQPTSKVFAERFYRKYLELNVRGLPDEKQLKSFSPYLSADLLRLFKKAQIEQKRFIKENSADMKPPWTDGDMFTSLFEGAQSYKIGKTKKRSAYTDVSVNLEYKENAKPSRWTDTLVLVQTKKGWRVWDIRLNGKWEFKSANSLRQDLSAKN